MHGPWLVAWMTSSAPQGSDPRPSFVDGVPLAKLEVDDLDGDFRHAEASLNQLPMALPRLWENMLGTD